MLPKPSSGASELPPNQGGAGAQPLQDLGKEHLGGESLDREARRTPDVLYGQLSKVQSGKMGPAPERFELSKGILSLVANKAPADVDDSACMCMSGHPAARTPARAATEESCGKLFEVPAKSKKALGVTSMAA